LTRSSKSESVIKSNRSKSKSEKTKYQTKSNEIGKKCKSNTQGIVVPPRFALIVPGFFDSLLWIRTGYQIKSNHSKSELEKRKHQTKSNEIKNKSAAVLGARCGGG
jgi:hypothetical protein